MGSRPTWRDASANSHIIFIFKMNMRGAGQSRRMRWVWGLRSPVGLIFYEWSVIERVVHMFETDLIDLVVDVVIRLYLGGGGASFVLNKSLYSFLADWCAGSELWPSICRHRCHFLFFPRPRMWRSRAWSAWKKIIFLLPSFSIFLLFRFRAEAAAAAAYLSRDGKRVPCCFVLLVESTHVN